MGQFLIRDLDDEVCERLRVRAAGKNHSLEAELREILVRASKQVDVAMARAAAEAIRRLWEGRPHSESMAQTREDRDRRRPHPSWSARAWASMCGAQPNGPSDDATRDAGRDSTHHLAPPR
jgi:plasmid stability protein